MCEHMEGTVATEAEANTAAAAALAKMLSHGGSSSSSIKAAAAYPYFLHEGAEVRHGLS